MAGVEYPRIVVVGGGYAGVLAARVIATRTAAEVVLVNPTGHFVERIRLHQVASGQRLRHRSLAGLLPRYGVEVVRGRVDAIDLGGREVHLSDGRALKYDHLVYSTGSEAGFGSVQGSSEHAYGVADLAASLRLRARLREASIVAVVGGGPTGIEIATEVAESHPFLTVLLVTRGELGATLSPRGRDHVRTTLERLGIQVRDRTTATRVVTDGLTLTDGTFVEADTVVWTTGFRATGLAREAGLAVDASGRVAVDRYGRSLSHPEIYAAGDAAAATTEDGAEPRMASATALSAGSRAARSLCSHLEGHSLAPLRFRYLNQCISLGRRDGLVQFVHSDDVPTSSVLTGHVAACYKELIVRSTTAAIRHPLLADLPYRW